MSRRTANSTSATDPDLESQLGDSIDDDIRAAIDADFEEEAKTTIRQMGYFVTPISVKKKAESADYRSPPTHSDRFLEHFKNLWILLRAYLADEEPPKTIDQHLRELGYEVTSEMSSQAKASLHRNHSEPAMLIVTPTETPNGGRFRNIVEVIRSYVADEQLPMMPSSNSDWLTTLRRYVADE